MALAVLAMLLVPIRSAAQDPASPPGAPTGVTATPGTLSATVAWSPSGAAADSYTVSSSPGGITTTVDGTSTSATVTGLGYLMRYTFTVAGTNSLGTGPASAPSDPITPGAPGGPYHQSDVGELANADVSAGQPLRFNLGSDRVHAPGLSAVVLNLTASEATAATDVQVVERGQVEQTISVGAGLVESSLVVVPAPAELTQASVQVTTGTTHVQIDSVGYFSDPRTVRDHSGLLTMVTPAPLLDATVASGSTTDVAVLGQGGVPSAHVGEVLVNVTATGAASSGTLSLVPTGSDPAGITTLGFAAGETTANRAIVAVPSSGSISIVDRYAGATVHVDVLGWFTDGSDRTALGSLYNAVSPARLLDTSAQGGPVPAGGSVNVGVWGRGGSPGANSTAPPTSALFEITAVAPAGPGSISVSGPTMIAFAAGEMVTGTVLAHLASDGSALVKVSGSATNVTVDLLAFFSGDLIVPGSTKALSPALLAGITSMGADLSITFAPGTQVSPPIQLNDVINAGISPTTPKGFLRRVLSITTLPSGAVVLSTRVALLSEALTAFTVDWVATPIGGSRFGAFSSGPRSMTATSASSNSGNPFPPPPLTSIDPNYPLLALATPSHPITASIGPAAEVSLTDIEVQVLPHVHLEYNFFTNTAKAAFAVSEGVRLALEFTITKDLKAVNFTVPGTDVTIPIGAEIPIPIGPIVVVITPVLVFAVTVDASISVGLTIGYRFDKFIQVTVSYDGSQFHTSQLAQLYADGITPPEASANADLKVASHTSPGIEFYDLPFFSALVDISRYMRYSASVTCSAIPLPPTCGPAAPWWTVSTGICLGVAMNLDLILVKKLFSQDFACVEQVLAHAPGLRLDVQIVPTSATVPRFQVQHFHAAVTNSPGGVTWSLPGGSGSGTLSTTNLSDADYTAPGRAGQYSVKAAANADPTSFSKAVITVPADAPSPPSGVLAGLTGPTSLNVTWNPPADDGGAPITDYKVVSSDGSTIDAGTATSVTITALTPGNTYTFSVFATNSANLTSAAAPSPAITIPGTAPITVKPPSLNFGTVTLGSPAGPLTVTVFAGAATPLTISTISLGGLNPTDYTIVSDLCTGQVVPAGGSCTFRVLFTANALGPSAASALINDNDPTSPQSVPLKAQVSVAVVVAACYLNTIAGGDRTTVVVDPTGKVFAWGANQYGQLGNGTNTLSPVPVAVSTSTGLPQVSEVSAGFFDTVVRTTSGTVWAWGNNSFGELGNTTVPGQSSLPVQVMGAGGTGFLTGVSDVSGSSFPFAVAVKSADGSVWAWGQNTFGELGNGTTTNSPTPVQVKGPGGVGFLTGVVKVAAGDEFVVALKSDGTVWAWGANGGALGNNTTTTMETTPVQVFGPNGVGFLTGIIAIGTHSFHTVAVRSDGTLVAWGNDPYGQLGNGFTPPGGSFGIPYPVVVSTLSGLTKQPSVVTGGEHSLAADPTTGKAWGWGWNVYGQVGDGTQIQRNSPSQVVAAANFTEVAAGAWHSIGLGSDGSVWTWGYNYYGQLGNGHLFVTVNPTPSRVSGVTAAQPGAC